MSSEYNGWTNYETWNIVLWINNDEGISDMIDGRLFRWFHREVENGNIDGKDVQEHFVNSVSFGALREIMGTDEAFPTNRTRDGVRLDDPSIDWSEIRSAIAERLDSRMIDSLNDYYTEKSNIPNNAY